MELRNGCILTQMKERGEEKTKGGLYIPDASITVKEVYTVVEKDDVNVRTVVRGDRLILLNNTPEKIRILDEVFYLCHEDNIVAVL